MQTKTYYIIKFLYCGKEHYVDIIDGRCGFNFSSVSAAQATVFPTISKALERLRHIVVHHAGFRYGVCENFSIYKVTETTTPGTTVRREVPLGTEGSKVAVNSDLGFLGHTRRGSSPFVGIDAATLFSKQEDALYALQTRVVNQYVRWSDSARLVGILEETSAPTVSRTEDIVPAPVEPTFTRRVTIVGSSVIKEVAYAPAERVLEVVFLDGKAYRYGDVPAYVVTDFVHAGSAGSYYTRQVRNQFPRVDA